MVQPAAESRDPSIASASSVATPQPSCDVDETLFRYQLIDRLASGKMWPADVAVSPLRSPQAEIFAAC